MKNKEIFLSDLALLVVAFIWGGGFIAGKKALASISPFYLMTFRFLLSGMLLSMIFYKKTMTLHRKDLICGLCLGFVMYMGFSMQTIGLRYTSAGKQGFLIATYTVMVPFVSWFLNKNKPDIYSLVSAMITLVGVGFISLKSDFSISFGDTLTLFFAVIFSIQIVLTGIYAKDIDPIKLTIIQMTTAGILSFITAFIFESVPVNIGAEGMFSIFYLVIFNTLIAFSLQTMAQKYAPDSHAAIIISLESVFGYILAVLLLGEMVTVNLVIGCALIFTAIILSKLKSRVFRLLKSSLS